MQSLNLKSISGTRRLTSQEAKEVFVGESEATFLKVDEAAFGELYQPHRKWLDSLKLYAPGFKLPGEVELKQGEGDLAPGNFQKVDLRHADLPSAQFAGAMMNGAVLNHANLEMAYFSGASLEGAQLIEVFARGIQMQCAQLSKAVMEGARMEQSDFAGANLEGAQLQGAALSLSDFWIAQMKDADLYGAFLKGVDLRGADLRGANLQMVNLQKANLEGADLRGADLRGADLYGTILVNANLAEANLQGVDMLGAKLEGAKLKGATMSGSDLQGAKLQGANLKGAKLQKGRSEEWQFEGKEDAALRFLARTVEDRKVLNRLWVMYLLLGVPIATLALASLINHWNLQANIFAYAGFFQDAVAKYEALLVEGALQPGITWIEQQVGLGIPGWSADYLAFHAVVGGAIVLLLRRGVKVVPGADFFTKLTSWMGQAVVDFVAFLTWPLLLVCGLMGVDRKTLLPLSIRGAVFLVSTVLLYVVLLGASSIPKMMRFEL